MTELTLYKFIKENKIEWHRQTKNNTTDVICFINFHQMESFGELIKNNSKEEGFNCVLKDGYIAIWMQELCDYFDVEINNVFVGEEY